LCPCLIKLSKCVSVNHISQRFYTKKINLAILEHPVGKLTRVRCPEARNLRQSVQNRPDHGNATMTMDFKDVLASTGMRRSHKQQKGFIKRLSIPAPEFCQRETSSLWAFGAKRYGNLSGLCTTDPQYRNRRFTGWGGQCKDGVALLRHKFPFV
jgi:hypothetical protein